MFAHCCGHATIVSQRQPLFGLSRCRCAARAGKLRRGKSGGAHRSQYGRSTTQFFQRENRLARISRDQTEFSKGLRVAESRTTRFARHLQRLIFRSPPLRTRSYNVRHPSCSKRIASFLCGRHFLRQFSSRHDAARDIRAESGITFHTRQNNVVRDLPRTFLIAIGNEARA